MNTIIKKTMTENERTKVDYLKWWLILISLISAGFIIYFIRYPLGMFALVINLPAIVIAWITWNREQRRIALILSIIPIILFITWAILVIRFFSGLAY
jgi:hypothetical protein